MQTNQKTGSKPIFISEKFTSYEFDQLLMPNRYREDIDRIMIPSGLIADRVEKMAKDIYKAYQGKPVHLLCVLKGGEQFFSDLKHYFQRFQRYNDGCDFLFTIDYIQVSSYEDDKSTGKLKVVGANLKKIAGENILIVEDIVDTGNTMKNLVENLIPQHNPKSISVASLLLKRTTRSCGFMPDYVGFSIPDFFVIGYSLDYNEVFRDLEHICIISEAGKDKYKKDK